MEGTLYQNGAKITLWFEIMTNMQCNVIGQEEQSKAPWAAHGWIAQSQVYFCLWGKTSLFAKLLVWKCMSPIRSFAWE